MIAEDLLLLHLNEYNGSVIGSTNIEKSLAGALLAELAIFGRVHLDAGGSVWRSARVVAVPGPPFADPLLAHALALVAERPRSAQAVVTRLGRGLREPLLGRLAARGVIQPQERRVLGISPSTGWFATSAEPVAGLRGHIAAALTGSAPLTPATGALVALLHADGTINKVVGVPGISGREVNRRAKVIGEAWWPADAVRRVIAAAAATTAGAAAAVAVVASS